ncbi:MAG: hypothetical protein LBI96_00775 [Odoribacteraceae bacterium]|jgi:hypothetical protein|nr:hypothetical protein [Odoribacteraceae bacterium]
MKNIACILAACLAAGCYEDKGHYDYVEINEVTIGGLPSQTTITLVDTARFFPELTFANPADTAGFTFLWRENSHDISTELNLAYVPTYINNNITLELYVKDRHGIAYRATTSVRVDSPYKYGFALLAEKEGKTAFHFLGRSNETGRYTPYLDMFAADPLGAGPLALATSTVNSLDEIIIFQQSGSLSLNGQNLERAVLLSDEFSGGAYPAGVNIISGYYNMGVDALLGDDGNLYVRVNPVSGVLHATYFMNMPHYFARPGTRVGRIIPTHPYTFSLWTHDEGNNRLLAITSETYPGNNNIATMGAELTINEGAAPAGFTSVNNMGADRLVYAADHRALNTQNITNLRNILKKTDGSYEVQSFTVSRSGLNLTMSAWIQQPFAGNGLVTDNTPYALRSDGKYIFFAVGGKLYSVEFRVINGIEQQFLQEVHDFGTDITLLTRADNSIDPDVGGEALGVALATGKFCIIMVTDPVLLDPTNAWQNGKVFESAANLGRIVSVLWKYGGSNSRFTNDSW